MAFFHTINLTSSGEIEVESHGFFDLGPYTNATCTTPYAVLFKLTSALKMHPSATIHYAIGSYRAELHSHAAIAGNLRVTGPVTQPRNVLPLGAVARCDLLTATRNFDFVFAPIMRSVPSLPSLS